MAPSPRFPDDDEERGCSGSSSDSDRDDALDEDLEALRRACMITGRRPGDLGGGAGSGSGSGSAGDSSDSEDDLGLLRSIQARFSAPLPAHGDRLPIVMPLNSILPSDSDEDDFQTLRAIQRRFERYENDAIQRRYENCSDQAALDAANAKSKLEISGFLSANRIGKPLPQDSVASATRETSSSISVATSEGRGDVSVSLHQVEDRTYHLSSRATGFSQFQKSAQIFMDALRRNRSCQKFIRSKLIEIEAKIERNKQLRERLKCLLDFQVASGKRITRVLSHKKDPRVRLISLPNLRTSNTSKASTRTPCPRGPPENSHVSKYREVLSRFPISLCRQPWSQTEKENLAKGVKQQYQEIVLLNVMELSSDLDGTIGNSAVISRNVFEFSPVDIRSFLPTVNWERLASMYLPGHSGAECEARWLNTEDPLINHDPWTTLEEKKLLHIVQNIGVYNWIDIATLLGTHRTPFQCLVHYQRSLNPCILKKDWTKDEDAQLRAAVKTFGEGNWQLVASTIEGRTGPQCSNRWRKNLFPMRKVGRWSVDEDKRLKVAVMLFGAKNWNVLAQFIPGRTQVQCRERWVNCLDPSLNLKAWSEEEDARLKEAISTYGCYWSKVASFVHSRTDNQCWRRWKVLFPDEVPLRQAAWKMQKAVLISNFVDRETERPSIGPNDFCLVPGMSSEADVHVNDDGARKKKLRHISKSVRSRKCKAKSENFKENASSGNQLVSSQKCKAQVENPKEDATGGCRLEISRHKTMSKRRKETGKQLMVLDQHEECLPMSDDVFQSDAAARTCSDMASLSDALQGCSSRRHINKAKSLQENLIGADLEEPSVDKTISRKKRKKAVSATSGLDDDVPLAVVLNGLTKASRKCKVMSTTENSPQGDCVTPSDLTKRKGMMRGRSCKLHTEGNGCVLPQDKVVASRSIYGIQDETPRMGMGTANYCQADMGQIVKLIEGAPHSISHREPENELNPPDVDQAIDANRDSCIGLNNSEKIAMPTITSTV